MRSDEQPEIEARGAIHKAVNTIESGITTTASDVVGRRVAPTSADRAQRQWEVVEEFEHEGYRYRLQRRSSDSSVRKLLTKREREVLSLMDQGLSRQQIATQLGLSPSTIGVLLHRAATKLGAKTRRQLLIRFRKHSASE